jgi:hypothetical protein
MEKRFVQTDVDHMIRDRTTTAVLNTDMSALEAYKKQRQRIQKTDNIIQDVDNLKRDLTEIKSLLAQLINDKYSKSC